MIQLTGKTQKGKNRVRECGDRWEVLIVDNRGLFDNRPGPWFFIRPIGGTDEQTRWIHGRDDVNFHVTKLGSGM